MTSSQVNRENLTRGRIDPVAIEVDEFEIVFAGHPPDGVNVRHLSSIGRLKAEIDLESK